MGDSGFRKSNTEIDSPSQQKLLSRGADPTYSSPITDTGSADHTRLWADRKLSSMLKSEASTGLSTRMSCDKSMGKPMRADCLMEREGPGLA